MTIKIEWSAQPVFRCVECGAIIGDAGSILMEHPQGECSNAGKSYLLPKHAVMYLTEIPQPEYAEVI